MGYPMRKACAMNGKTFNYERAEGRSVDIFTTSRAKVGSNSSCASIRKAERCIGSDS